MVFTPAFASSFYGNPEHQAPKLEQDGCQTLDAGTAEAFHIPKTPKTLLVQSRILYSHPF